MNFPVPRTAPSGLDLEIHQLSELTEFTEAVRLQRQIWGFDDAELLPPRLFVVASKIGGQVLGAFDRNKMVAFCLCIPGLKPGGNYYLHSHMLGVLPSYRDSGIGRRLKWKQREFALASEVDLIEWTFDPLEIKNAFFNIERLGAVVRRYVHNQYGTTTSPLHAGLPTDRLIAEWWIRTDRVEAHNSGRPFEAGRIEARISVPLEIAQIREQDPNRAQEIQRSVAEQFDQHFRQRLTVIGFKKEDHAGTYLLGQWESK
ncbi:MAG: GNAT family N-acetyltransferase [Acidobacteriaceae bacterium]|nr:GNAT family N-acetyltransferase [Acidobacteriaceae bacterium]MBV9501054.1 GNAT family N-acetyltransferase [Acidobacteriaceae bacterium]